MAGRGLNGKSRTSKGSSQDYTNLLFSESDSDDRVPDLKLPSVKGKKQKRRKNSGPRQDETCTAWNVLKVLLVISILAGMTALATITFWSLKKITEMQDQIEKLQQSQATISETTNLQKNLLSLNRSIAELKLKTAGGLTADVENVKIKMKELETTKAELDEKLKSAKNFLDLPSRFTVLKKSVVDMGSELKQTQDNQEEIKKQIGALQETVEKPAPTSATGVGQSDIDSFTRAMNEIKTMNETFIQAMATLKKTVDNQELKNNSTDVETNDQTDVDALRKELVTLKTDFLAFKFEIIEDMQSVNSTVHTFSKEFEGISAHLAVVDNVLTNLSNLINASKSENKNMISEQPLPAFTQIQSVPTASSIKGEGDSENQGLDSENQGQDSENQAGNHEDEEEGRIKPNVMEVPLKIHGINNRTTLQDFFENNLQPDENGIEITQFAQRQHLNETEVRKYDTNQDGYFTEEELATLMGFPPETKRRRKRSEW